MIVDRYIDFIVELSLYCLRLLCRCQIPTLEKHRHRQKHRIRHWHVTYEGQTLFELDVS